MTQREEDIESRLSERVRDELDAVDVESEYDAMIDEVYTFKNVGGPFVWMLPHSVLNEMDPVAYRCGKSDWLDSESDRLEEIDGDYYLRDEVDKLREQIADEIDDDPQT